MIWLLAVLAGLAAATDPLILTPSSLPPPLPSASTATTAVPDPDPVPSKPPASPSGPVCECGYTYCAAVLMKMKTPWSQKQLSDAYCKTPGAPCSGGAPATDVGSALFLCLCGDADQDVGNELHLVCGCDKCLVVAPDYRGRCATPCHAGSCGK